MNGLQTDTELGDDSAEEEIDGEVIGGDVEDDSAEEEIDGEVIGGDVEDDSAEEEIDGEVIGGDVEDDPEEKLEQDPEEVMDNDEEEDPEEAIDDEEDADPEEAMDYEGEADPEGEDNKEEDDPEGEMDNEEGDDPEQVMDNDEEEDPEEVVDDEEDADLDEAMDDEEEGDPEEEDDKEADDPEKEMDDEKENDPEEETDNEEEDDPKEEEISEESGRILDEDQLVKELHIEKQKNCGQVEYLKSEYDCGSAASEPNGYDIHSSKPRNDGYSSGKQDGTGSSGKRRRTRWDQEPEGGKVEETVEAEGSSKRRKTRWDSIDSQIKLVGPLRLPDFTNDDVLVSEFDTEMQNMRDELVDIDNKLQRPVIHDERSDEEQSPSPEPSYNELGIRSNRREAKLCQKLIDRRQYLISRLIKKQPTFTTPKSSRTPKLRKKLYVPVKQYPGYNFAGLIIGPRGNTQKRMEKETGAKISLRGSGSFSRGNHATENDDLHVLIQSDNEDSLDAASRMVEKLLTPINENMNDHKWAQLRELAELKKFSKDQNMCYICGEHGHQYHACPHRLFYSPSIFSGTSDSTDTFSGNETMQLREPFFQGSGTVYVSQLPGSVDDHLLKELFCPFGNLVEAKVISEEKAGKTGSCGFVKFEDPNDAVVAASRLNGFEYKSSRLAVKAARSLTTVGSAGQKSSTPTSAPLSITGKTAWLGPPGSLLTEPQVPFPESHSFFLEDEPCLKNWADLFVSNLPDSVDENRLKELFCPFGRITEATVARDGKSGRSKGCGSVRFDNPEDAFTALAHLNGFEVEGKVLTVSRNFPSPSPLYAGHNSFLPKDPSFTFTPPSTGSSSFDIGSMNSAGSSNNFSDQSPFSSFVYMAGYPAHTDYRSWLFGAHSTIPGNRPSPPSQLVHTPDSNIKPILWPIAPRPS